MSYTDKKKHKIQSLNGRVKKNIGRQEKWDRCESEKDRQTTEA